MQRNHNSRKIHKICKWSFRSTGKLFVFFCLLIPMRPRDIHGAVQRGCKRYFKQTEKCTSLFQTLQDADIFPISPPFFWKLNGIYTLSLFLRLKDRKNSIFGQIFILLYLQNTCYRDMQLTYVSIYQYRSSYIIKHWPAGNFTMKNESIRAYYCSTPRQSSIK